MGLVSRDDGWRMPDWDVPGAAVKCGLPGATSFARVRVGADDRRAKAQIAGRVHHADILALKGDSYRLRDRELARPPAAPEPEIA
jgi:hypothetical protein